MNGKRGIKNDENRHVVRMAHGINEYPRTTATVLVKKSDEVLSMVEPHPNITWRRIAFPASGSCEIKPGQTLRIMINNLSTYRIHKPKRMLVEVTTEPTEKGYISEKMSELSTEK